jgi:hypothetical protein
MQNIKKQFEMIKNANNVVSNIKHHKINDWYKKINMIFSLMDTNLKHKGKATIIKLINNQKKTESMFDFTAFDPNVPEYHLPGCYNISSHKQMVNIGFFQIEDISINKPTFKELYSAVVYNYIVYMIHSKKVKFNVDITQNIINYYTSMFMSLFGKQYGMTGIYTAKIPRLKFCIACYILASYFGLKDRQLLENAQSQSTYSYNDDVDLLKKYDFSTVEDFVKMLSDMDVFPGFNIYKMMGRIYTSFGVSFLAAFEDFGRFIAMIEVCMISGNGIAPAFIYKYNKHAFDGISKITTVIYK